MKHSELNDKMGPKKPDPVYPDLPCDPDAPVVCLVVKGSPEALVFEHAEELAEGKGFVPLTLKGMNAAKALVPQGPQPRNEYMCGNEVIGVGVGSVDIAVRARLDDRSFLTCEDNNAIFSLTGSPFSGAGMIRKGDELRMNFDDVEELPSNQFKVNLDDGTISPVEKTGIQDAKIHPNLDICKGDPDLVFGLKV